MRNMNVEVTAGAREATDKGYCVLEYSPLGTGDERKTSSNIYIQPYSLLSFLNNSGNKATAPRAQHPLYPTHQPTSHSAEAKKLTDAARNTTSGFPLLTNTVYSAPSSGGEASLAMLSTISSAARASVVRSSGLAAMKAER